MSANSPSVFELHRSRKAAPTLCDIRTAVSGEAVALLVLGMHRSGTSVLTRLLALAGAALPQRMIPAAESNRSGHWESSALVKENDRRLAASGLGWDDWQSPCDAAQSAPPELAQIIAQEYGRAELIVLKDPRICRFVPEYLAALSNLNFRTLPILAFRHPGEVIRSLMQRSNWKAEKGELDAALLWLAHTLEAEAATRRMDRVIASYDRTLTDWPALLRDIERRGGIDFPEPKVTRDQAIDAFLCHADRHHRLRDEELAHAPVTSGWLRRSYEALRGLERDPACPKAMASLDQVRQELSTAIPMLTLALSERDSALTTAREAEHMAQDQRAAQQQAVQRTSRIERELAAARQHGADQAVALADAAHQLEQQARARETERAEMTRRLDEQARAAAIELAANLDKEKARARAQEVMLLDQLRSAEERFRDIEDGLRRQLERSAEEAQVIKSALEDRMRCALELAEDRSLSLRETAEALSVQTMARTELEQGFEQERAALLNQFALARAAGEARTQQLLEAQDLAYRNSTSWRMTTPVRYIGEAVGRVRRTAEVLKETVALLGGAWPTAAIAARILRHQGIRGLVARLRLLRARGYQLTAAAPENVELLGDCVNAMAADRRGVLLSDWHVALTRALWEPGPVEAAGPTLGLSIVTHNSARWLPEFLSSLLEQEFPLSRLNVVVVDHESHDASVDLLNAHQAEYGSRYASFTIHLRPNRGFGAGHDHAIRTLGDDFVLISNVDLRFHPDSLTRAWRAAMADRSDVASWELRQCPYEHPKYYDPVTLEAVWSSHACVLFRRDAYLAVGGYDLRIFMYGEDVELSYRFRGAGWRLRYLPQVTVTHYVDLDDTRLRPNQLAGSLAANVLLRYRYGGDGLGAEGESLLAGILANERQPSRRAAMIEAQTRILEHREHFRTSFRPVHAINFPFAGFDFIFARDGARVANTAPEAESGAARVSVVTRTHGSKTGLLREALAAVINQSYADIEHLVVEDRGDVAGALVRRTAAVYGRDIRYLTSLSGGRTAAGNMGLAEARGDLLMLLDHDDLLFCDHIEVLQRKLATRPELAAAYALGWEVQTQFDEDGGYREITHILPPGHRHAFDRERLMDVNFMPIQTILFRRGLFEAEGGFDLDLDHLEDWNLWSRYANHGDFEMIPKLTSLYRTPADPAARAQRQADLDAAYLRVKALNALRRQELEATL